MITKQRGELLGLSIALKTQKVDEKYKKKTTWIPRTIAKRRNYGNITGEQQYKKSNKENRWGKGDMNAPTHNP